MKKRSVLLVHLAFWVLVMALRLPMITKDASYLGVLLLSMSLHFVIFYLFYFLFAKILLKKMIISFIIIYILFLILYCVPVTLVFIYGYLKLESFGLIKPTSHTGDDIFKVYFSVLTTQSIYAALGSFFRLTVDWFRNIRKQEMLEKQNIANELALLRSQINPHFLFNTLNNIHSFVYSDQDKTSFGIIKLSEIMRYMLFEANSDKVLLEKEIKYIENYIELQKIRLKDPKFIELQIEGDFIKKEIPPMLLINFVENAFKHCRKNSPSPGIKIILKIVDNSLTFEVKNYISTIHDYRGHGEGFGLKNIQRRLDLIYGKGYNLDIIKDNDEYTVKLFIENLMIG